MPTSDTPTLLEVEARPVPARAAGVFTGDRFFTTRREDYDRILELRAQGRSIRAIAAEIHGVGFHTILAIIRHNAGTIRERKAQLSAECMDVATLATEEIKRRLEDCPTAIETSDLVKIGNSAIEKGLLLAGEATQRVENTTKLEKVDEHALLAEYIGRLPGCETGRSAEKDGPEKKGAFGPEPGSAGGSKGAELLDVEAQVVEPARPGESKVDGSSDSLSAESEAKAQ